MSDRLTNEEILEEIKRRCIAARSRRRRVVHRGVERPGRVGGVGVGPAQAEAEAEAEGEAMTPAQKVATDAMREAWAPEVVERMLRAVDPRMEAVAEAARDYVDAHDDPRWHRLLTGEERSVLSDTLERTYRAMRDAAEASWFMFSPGESRTGASTPQPPGETPTCAACGERWGSNQSCPQCFEALLARGP